MFICLLPASESSHESLKKVQNPKALEQGETNIALLSPSFLLLFQAKTEKMSLSCRTALRMMLALTGWRPVGKDEHKAGQYSQGLCGGTDRAGAVQRSPHSKSQEKTPVLQDRPEFSYDLVPLDS